MLKVCHLTSVHNSNDVRIFYKECTSLAAGGYETYLVARGESREENGVHVVGVGAPPAARLRRILVFANTIYKKALSLDADIYHLHDPELLPYGIKLKKHGKKVIFDSHEDTLNQIVEKKWIPKAIRTPISTGYRVFAKNAYAKYDALISVTPHVAEQLKEINPRTYQITNYPILAQTVHPPNADGQFLLCFTGGIDTQWSHESILSAMNGVPAIQYVLCGRASDTYLKLLQGLPAWKNTDYRGTVSHEDAVNLQQAANAGMALLRSSNNTGGNRGTIGNTKLFEYMMSGLPVICSDFILWKQIIEKYNCGICIDPTDIDAIASAIVYLRDHPDEARRMGQNGRRAVEEEFNWKTQEEKLLQLYRALQ